MTKTQRKNRIAKLLADNSITSQTKLSGLLPVPA